MGATRKPKLASSMRGPGRPNPSSLAPERLARLRKLCLGLPDSTEKMAWGDPTWRVRDRIFAAQKGNYAGGRPSLWLKVREGGQALLVSSKPEHCFVPPYVGHKGWVGIYLDGRTLPWALVAELIQESYGLIAPVPRARKNTKKHG